MDNQEKEFQLNLVGKFCGLDYKKKNSKPLVFQRSSICNDFSGLGTRPNLQLSRALFLSPAQ